MHSFISSGSPCDLTRAYDSILAKMGTEKRDVYQMNEYDSMRGAYLAFDMSNRDNYQLQEATDTLRKVYD